MQLLVHIMLPPFLCLEIVTAESTTAVEFTTKNVTTSSAGNFAHWLFIVYTLFMVD